MVLVETTYRASESSTIMLSIPAAPAYSPAAVAGIEWTIVSLRSMVWWKQQRLAKLASRCKQQRLAKLAGI